MPCSICGQTGHYRTTCPSRNVSLVTHDETPPALPKSSLQDVVAAAKAFCAQRTQLSASSSAFSSARVVGAAPRATVSSTYGIHGASRLLDTDITTYWQSNDSGSRRPHWIELTSAQDGVPLGELSWYIKDFGSYTPQDILVKKRVGADARWDAGKSITLPSSPEGWRTLLSAAEMGTADRVRVEVLSNLRGPCDSKVAGVRTSDSGKGILVALEAAISRAEAEAQALDAAGVALIGDAKAAVAPLRQAVAEWPLRAAMAELKAVAVAFESAVPAQPISLHDIHSLAAGRTRAVHGSNSCAGGSRLGPRGGSSPPAACSLLTAPALRIPPWQSECAYATSASTRRRGSPRYTAAGWLAWPRASGKRAPLARCEG